MLSPLFTIDHTLPALDATERLSRSLAAGPTALPAPRLTGVVEALISAHVGHTRATFAPFRRGGGICRLHEELASAVAVRESQGKSGVETLAGIWCQRVPARCP